MKTITMIGAGSAAFTISLLRDILLSEGLKDAVLRLVDTDEARLDLVACAALSYNEEAHASLSIERYTDRCEALDGTDFVLCAVKMGGYVPLENERKIAECHGYYRGIGDRVSCYFGGIGAYWQIRFLEELARDMERLCPDAWLIQTANPVFDGTNFVTRNTRIKAVGICHGHLQAYRIADIIGLDRRHVSFEVAGLNHHIFLTDFRYNGENAYPLLDEWIENKSEAYWRSASYNTPGEYQFAPEELTPGAIATYRLYGLMPVGDTIRSATPWWQHTDIETKTRYFGVNGGFDSEICWPAYLRKKDMHRNLIRTTLAEGKPITDAFPLTPSGEQHIPLIDTMTTDKTRVFTLNIPNNGCLPDVPDDVMVEIPAVANASGVHGIRLQPLPRRIMDNVINPRIRTMNNLHDAYQTGRRDLLVLELMLDARTRSLSQAQKLVDELLRQSWNADADKHYR